MLHDLCGFNWSVATMQYDDLWRRHRAVLHTVLNKATFMQYRGTLERYSRTLLVRLHHSPEKFLEHSRHILGAIILGLTYGIKVRPEHDPFVETSEIAATIIGEVSSPGAFYVDVLPILKYVPAWFPGAGFQHKAKQLNQYLQDMIHIPFNQVKASMKAGKATPSVVSNFLEDLETRQDVENFEEEEEILRYIGGVMYLGGIDTTESTVQSFFLAMILYPDVQKAAQRELDKVIGSKSLPSFEDRPNLPYIEAVVKETLRWHPVAPCGFPHRLKEDDIIGEYFVPKGTVVMGNIW
ncbi:hypothetical protein Clacol_000044 [Clathrus columnatus]|uniref:Cytochrome P450 n=1 Tax=Clathrus columnatus TaxID=1419009 RepID=A0AAV4ZXQ6_9AGAM|nr:hypothetical protein Clacol_000044 [Clathrus columnatus]